MTSLVKVPVSGSGAGSTDPQWSSFVGIVTAIVGNILISFALNTQRYAHIRIDRESKYQHDKGSKQARKHLPKSLRGYGTAVEQERVAEERAEINAKAPGPVGEPVEEERHTPEQNGKPRRGSDDTLRPKEDQEAGEEHGEGDENREGESSGRKSYLKSPWWWLGIVMMTIGEAGNFLAYGFAPASIVSPLGVVALVSNCLIAPLMLKERFRQRDFWGVLIAIAGAVVVVLSAKQNEQKLGPGDLWADIKRWEFLTYIAITLVLSVALMFASRKYGRQTILIDLGLVGLFGGYTALSTKGVASLLSGSLYRAFTYPITYVLVLVLVSSAIMQIRYLNKALQNFDSTQVIPIQFVLFTLSVIIGSAILYRDFERTDLDHAVKFIVGCILTFSGVYLITSGRKRDDEDDDNGEYSHEETIRLIDEEAELENEHTPLMTESGQSHQRTQDQGDGTPQTPRRTSEASSRNAPSIKATHVTESGPERSTTYFSDPERDQNRLERSATTPRSTLSRMASSSSQTHFYTPSTSRRPDRLQRIATTPSRSETPTRPGPSPFKGEDSRFARSARDSISKLIPGPLLQPLSGSLSAVIADSIRKGEGSPRAVRASLRRQRSSRNRPNVQSDADFTGTSMPRDYAGTTLSRQPTLESQFTDHDEDMTGRGDSMSGQGESAIISDSVPSSLGKHKGRLRSTSETLGGFMDRARGKQRERVEDTGESQR